MVSVPNFNLSDASQVVAPPSAPVPVNPGLAAMQAAISEAELGRLTAPGGPWNGYGNLPRDSYGKIALPTPLPPAPLPPVPAPPIAPPPIVTIWG